MFSKLAETINSKGFLLFMIAVFLFPFFVLSSWNHPSLDDFNIGVLKKSLSFSQIQSFYYLHWSGRFTYGILNSLFASSGFLYHYYRVFGAFFLLSTFLAFLFTLSQSNRFILQKKFSEKSLIVVAALLLIMELHVIPEVKTQFYWFTSALTYQMPVIIFTLMIGFMVRTFADNKNRAFGVAAIFILDLLANGFNEMFSIFLLVIGTFLLAFHMRVQKGKSKIVFVLYVWNIISFMLMFSAPGMWERRSHYPARSVLVSAAVGVGKFFIANWFFLKEPIWWLFCAILIAWLIRNPIVTNNRMAQWLQKQSFIKLAVVYVIIGLLIYVPTLIGSHASLPYRAENAVCFFFSLILLLLISVKASTFFISLPAPASQLIYRFRFVLLAVMIFATTLSGQVVQSLVSGYFYHKIMKEREDKLFGAAEANQQVVETDSYNLALKKKMAETFTGRVPITLQEMIEQKPVLLFVDDYLYKDSVIKHIYGVERVVINGKPDSTQ